MRSILPLLLLTLSSACASTPPKSERATILGLEVPPYTQVTGDLNSGKWLGVEVVYAAVPDQDYTATLARIGNVLAKTEAITEAETKTWRRKYILLANGGANYAFDEGKQVPFVSQLHFVPNTNSAKARIEIEPTGVVITCDNHTKSLLLSASYVGLDRMTQADVHEPKGNVMGAVETPHFSREKGDMMVTDQWMPMSPRDYQGTGSRIVLFARSAPPVMHALTQTAGSWAGYDIKK